jgi:hypothetical protein
MMKNLLLTLTFLLITFLCLSQTATLSLPQIDAASPGTQINIPIYVDDISGLVTGVEIYLLYNPEVMTPVSYQNIHPNFQDNLWTINLNYLQNEVFLLWVDGDFTGKEILAGEAFLEIVFDVIDSGYSDLIIDISKNNSGSKEKGYSLIIDEFFNSYSLIIYNGWVQAHFCYESITGNAFLEDQTDHSNIKVKFIPQSPSAELDSTYTSESGAYNISVLAGLYTIEFSKQDYITQYYNNGNSILIAEDVTLSPITLTYTGGDNLAGSVSGTLTNENPYLVIDDVYVAEGDTLVIDEGTIIKIQNGCHFEIFGLIMANGTELNPIQITSENQNPLAGDWGNFKFYFSNSNSYLHFCNLEYGNQIIITYSDIAIENNNILYFEQGIDCSNSEITLINNTFQDCYENAVYFEQCQNIVVSGNEVYAPNFEGYRCFSFFDSKGLIENNSFFGNEDFENSALYIDNFYGNHHLDLSGNLITNFTNGIYFHNNSWITFSKKAEKSMKHKRCFYMYFT